MVDGVEGVGEAITGAMFARAAEPAAGEARPGHHTTCLNCGAALTGNYCNICGQQAHVHRSLGAFWHDLAHSVLHFEGKIWRTLPLLAWRPGELTRRYIHGERARFVSPMALFLFSVFAMFATFSSIGGPFELGMDANEFRNTRAEMATALDGQRYNLKVLEESRADAVKARDLAELPEIDREIDGARRAIAALESVQDATEGQRTEFIGGVNNTGWERLDKGIKKLNESPSLAFYKIQNNAYKFSWLLIPLSVPFLWLLFPFRRDLTLYDHVVFVTYSLSFMTLMMVLLSFGRAAGLGDAIVNLAFAFLPPIHMYRQLKGAYRLQRWNAVFRTLLLFLFANVAFALFVTLLVVLGAIT